MGLLSWLLGQEKNTNTKFSVDENEKLDGLSLNDIIKSHMDWKVRLSDYLNGNSTENLDASNINPDNLCVLGKWVYGDGKNNYGNSPEWSKLRDTHAKFHKCAAGIVEEHNNGKPKEAKEQLEGEFAHLSSQIRIDLAMLYRMTVEK